MILESIHLKNFGPYRDTTIMLDGVRSATVCGVNGAGKSSAFVDGPLWCLFGECRTDTDKMIRLGQTDMAVTLVIRVGGQRYRVMRSRSVKTKRGKSEFQVQLWTGEHWEAVARDSIESILQADYRICTSTNFLVQGRFDQVSTAKPAERKKLIFDILGLSRYADYAAAARQRRSRAEGALSQLAKQLDEAEVEAANHGRVVAQLAIVESELESHRDKLKAAQQSHREMGERRAAVTATLEASMPDQGAVDRLQRKRDALLQAIAEGERSLQEQTVLADKEPWLLSRQHELKAVAENLGQATAQRQTVLEQVKAADDEWQAIQEQRTSLQGQLHEVAQRRAVLESDIRHLEYQIAERKSVLAADEAREEAMAKLTDLDALRAQADQDYDQLAVEIAQIQETLDARSRERESLRQRLDDARKEEQRLIRDREAWVRAYQAETTTLTADLKEAERQAGLLKTVPCGVELQRQCGFTKAAVAAQAKLPELQAAVAERETDIRALTWLAPVDVAAATEQVKELEAALAASSTTDLESDRGTLLQRQADCRATAQRVGKEIADLRSTIPEAGRIERAKQELPDLEKAMDEKEEEFLRAVAKGGTIQQQLDVLPLADTKTAVAVAKGRLEDIEAQRERLRRKQDELTAELVDLPAAQHARAQLPALRRALDEKHQEVELVVAELSQAQAAAQKMAELEAERTQLSARLADAAQLIDHLESAIQRYSGERSTMQAAAKQTETALAQAERLQKEVAAERGYLEQWSCLVEAYQRVPMLIFENALPVLEGEANRLLDMMSASGMRLAVETQKALKSKDAVVDTVDLIVRDRVGERPYEAFSGGERMRLDLALRLGLSRLIASRAGSKIQTLVIDEAFAPLDRDGVQRMRHCLSMLEPEYPLLVVVTHDEDLKDSLGSQVLVKPTPDGSEVEVLA